MSASATGSLHARHREGQGFDVKAWHAMALELGPMGLAQIQRELGGGG